MTIAQKSPRRRRRQPEELRVEAIAAARDILVEHGPGSITLQAVATAIGMAHGSITHHFGTAGNLQAAVADGLIEQLLTEVRNGTIRLKAGEICEADLVDMVFDTFEKTGVGKLIGWLSASQSPMLQPMFDRFARLSREIATDRRDDSAFTEAELPIIVESIVSSALTSSLIGHELLTALSLPPNFTRQRVAESLSAQRSIRIAQLKRDV